MQEAHYKGIHVKGSIDNTLQRAELICRHESDQWLPERMGSRWADGKGDTEHAGMVGTLQVLTGVGITPCINCQERLNCRLKNCVSLFVSYSSMKKIIKN